MAALRKFNATIGHAGEAIARFLMAHYRISLHYIDAASALAPALEPAGAEARWGA